MAGGGLRLRPRGSLATAAGGGSAAVPRGGAGLSTEGLGARVRPRRGRRARAQRQDDGGLRPTPWGARKGEGGARRRPDASTARLQPTGANPGHQARRRASPAPNRGAPLCPPPPTAPMCPEAVTASHRQPARPPPTPRPFSLPRTPDRRRQRRRFSRPPQTRRHRRRRDFFFTRAPPAADAAIFRRPPVRPTRAACRRRGHFSGGERPDSRHSARHGLRHGLRHGQRHSASPMRRAFFGYVRHSLRHVLRHGLRHSARHAFLVSKIITLKFVCVPVSGRSSAHTHTRTIGSAGSLATASLRSANSEQLRNPPISPPWLGWLHHPLAVACSQKKFKKVAESFGGSDFFRTFATMKEQQYVITGISRLTGNRDEISRPMGYDEAVERLQRELESRRMHKHPAYTRLRVEKRLPVQLTFQFQDYE